MVDIWQGIIQVVWCTIGLPRLSQTQTRTYNPLKFLIPAQAPRTHLTPCSWLGTRAWRLGEPERPMGPDEERILAALLQRNL